MSARKNTVMTVVQSDYDKLSDLIRDELVLDDCKDLIEISRQAIYRQIGNYYSSGAYDMLIEAILMHDSPNHWYPTLPFIGTHAWLILYSTHVNKCNTCIDTRIFWHSVLKRRMQYLQRILDTIKKTRNGDLRKTKRVVQRFYKETKFYILSTLPHVLSTYPSDEERSKDAIVNLALAGIRKVDEWLDI